MGILLFQKGGFKKTEAQAIIIILKESLKFFNIAVEVPS